MPSSNPVALDKESAISMALQVLREPNDFIGFVDAYGTTIQFYCDDSGEIWVEIPYPSEHGSYGKHISLEEVEYFVQELPDIFTDECIPDGEFVAW